MAPLRPLGPKALVHYRGLARLTLIVHRGIIPAVAPLLKPEELPKAVVVLAEARSAGEFNGEGPRRCGSASSSLLCPRDSELPPKKNCGKRHPVCLGVEMRILSILFVNFQPKILGVFVALLLSCIGQTSHQQWEGGGQNCQSANTSMGNGVVNDTARPWMQVCVTCGSSIGASIARGEVVLNCPR